ncbi:MAG TPA: glycosyltransferase family A protein, partial [Acidimicrobiales bacterium]|nr:glycosyltransferase family A protein [Acidimicrobiales bacterium]
MVCAYTEERWPLLVRAVDSVRSQSRPALEVLVCVDHNQALLDRARSRFEGGDPTGVPVAVLANAGP